MVVSTRLPGRPGIEATGHERLTTRGLRSKIQDPRSREDPRNKNQSVRPRRSPPARTKCRASASGAWNLDLLWILDLGAWFFCAVHIT